jgi:phytoene desaturase
MSYHSNIKRVVVVGAGPGGLTSAMILAKRGLRVTVVEKENRPGGRNASMQLGPYTFDTGPTFLMLKRVLDEVFYEAGASTSNLLDMRKLDPMYRLQFGDRSIDISSDQSKMMRQISETFPGREKGYDSFKKRESARFERLFPCLQKSYHRFSTLLQPDLIKAVPHLAAGRSLFDNMKHYFQDEELATCFTFQAKYLGMSPWQCPGLFSIIPYIEHAFGIYHPIGGLSRISDAMADVARGHGAEIMLGTAVKRVLTEGNEAKGVELESGERIEADDVVLNADFGYAAGNLFDRGVLKKYNSRRLEKTKMSCSTFMLYLGVKGSFEMPHHMIVFADDYKKNVEDVVAGRLDTGDISFYVRNASITDSTLAPEGNSAVYVLVPVPNLRGDPDWHRLSKQFRDLVVQKLETAAGLENLGARIEEEHVITPLDWQNDYNLYVGSTFNLSHNLSQMLYMRPRNKFEELEHCYLAGGGTHPGSGLPTIYESGRIAANLVCRSYNMEFETHNLEV